MDRFEQQSRPVQKDSLQKAPLPLSSDFSGYQKQFPRSNDCLPFSYPIAPINAGCFTTTGSKAWEIRPLGESAGNAEKSASLQIIDKPISGRYNLRTLTLIPILPADWADCFFDSVLVSIKCIVASDLKLERLFRERT